MRVRLISLLILLLLAGLVYTTDTRGVDAGRIVYINQGNASQVEVGVLGAPGGRLITDNDISYFVDTGYPTWSPDGSQIAFDGEIIRRGQMIRESALFLADAETGSYRIIYEGSAYFPRFSPNGLQIAFMVVGESGASAVLLHLNTGRLVELGEARGVQNFIAWSPDGVNLAFPSPDGLTIVNAEGGERREFELDSGSYAGVVWSPDGTRLTVAGFGGAFLVDVTTLGIERIADTVRQSPGCSCAATFSDDGRLLALPVRVEQRSGVRVIDTATGETQDIALDGYVDNLRFSPAGTQLLIALTAFTGREYVRGIPQIHGTYIRLLDLQTGTLRDVQYVYGYRVAWHPVLDFTALSELTTVFTPTNTPQPSATPIRCEGAPQTRLFVGVDARVTISPPDQPRQDLRVRETPAGTQIASLGEATNMRIIGGPQCVDGYLWWEIETLDGTVRGWSAEGTLDDYFIERTR